MFENCIVYTRSFSCSKDFWNMLKIPYICSPFRLANVVALAGTRKFINTFSGLTVIQRNDLHSFAKVPLF